MFPSASSAFPTTPTGEPPVVQVPSPAPAGWETGGTPHALPWERLDATWPTLPESLTGGLDGSAQRLVRRCLTAAVGARLRLIRSLGPESRRLWETRPHLAQYVRQRRFFPNLLPRYGLAEFLRLLYTEAALAVEVLETPPSRLGVEEWAALVELQCQRIALFYAHLRERIGAQAQQELAQVFKWLPGYQA